MSSKLAGPHGLSPRRGGERKVPAPFLALPRIRGREGWGAAARVAPRLDRLTPLTLSSPPASGGRGRVGGRRVMSRIEKRFAALRAEGRAGLVAYLIAGDPDPDTSARLFAGLPGAGADLIEMGMPFSDPMADGPAIQDAGQRALKAGMTLRGTLAMVRSLRRNDDATPIVLMGYYNPIYRYGAEVFARDAVSAGVDGVIVVDLPPEEDSELTGPARAAGLDVIRLATPTSDDGRLPVIVGRRSGFIYYVAIAGITGTRSADSAEVAAAVARLRRFTDLPVAVGFGIKNPEQAAAVAPRRRRRGGRFVAGAAVSRQPRPRWSRQARPGRRRARRCRRLGCRSRTGAIVERRSLNAHQGIAVCANLPRLDRPGALGRVVNYCNSTRNASRRGRRV